MNILQGQYNKAKQYFYNNYTAGALKLIIVVWALFIIFVTLFLTDDNVILLAGIAAYEMLP